MGISAMRMILILLILMNIAASETCHAGAFDEFLEAVAKSVKYDFGERIMPDVLKIIAALQEFLLENQKYPKNYTELAKFAVENDIDMNFKAMSNVKLTRLDDGAMAVDYNVTMTVSKAISGRSGAPRPLRQRIILRPKEDGKGFHVIQKKGE